MTEIKHSNKYSLEYGVEGTDVMISYKVTTLSGQTRDRTFTSTTVLYQDLPEVDQETVKSGLYVGDALFSGFTGKFVNTSGRDDAVGDASLT